MGLQVFVGLCLCLLAYQASGTFLFHKLLHRHHHHHKYTCWSGWSAWSQCSATCGMDNYKFRTRECKYNVHYSRYMLSRGAPQCQGSGWEKVHCNRRSCPVNGEWGEWGSWSDCSVSCGGGIRIRRRECDSPEPSYGGHICDGHHKKKEECNNHACHYDRYNYNKPNFKNRPKKVYGQTKDW